MKLLLITLFLLVNVLLIGIEVQAGFVYDIMGKYQYEIEDNSIARYKVSDDSSVYFQILKHVNKAKLGVGVEYLPPRSVSLLNSSEEDTNSRIQQICYLPVYLVVQIPVNYEGNIFEGIAECGYSYNYGYQQESLTGHPYSDKNIVMMLSEKNFKGGMHAGLGFAFRTNNLAFQMMYKVENGTYSNTRVKNNAVDNSHVSLSVRLNLDLTSKTK